MIKNSVTSQCDRSATSQCDRSVTSQCDRSVTSQCIENSQRYEECPNLVVYRVVCVNNFVNNFFH